MTDTIIMGIGVFCLAVSQLVIIREVWRMQDEAQRVRDALAWTIAELRTVQHDTLRTPSSTPPAF